MKNGDLVVVNKPGNHFHGYVGIYEDRGEGYETVMVANGCSKLSVYPKDLKPYSFEACGPVPYPGADATGSFNKNRELSDAAIDFFWPDMANEDGRKEIRRQLAVLLEGFDASGK